MAPLSDMSVRPRALITGIRGFTGHYLAQALSSAGYEVYGTAHGSEAGGERIFSVDLCDKAELARVLQQVQPEVVAHLAAIAFVAHGDVDAIYRVNVLGTRNLLEALASLPTVPSAVLLASSANVYGNATVEVIDEIQPLMPANDYAISKLAMEHVARLWMDKLPIILTRPFNYTGVGQSEQFLIPKIVHHFKTRASSIELGNLDVAREFSDVRMVAQAYTRLLQQAPAGQTFNVCSGVAYTLREVISMAEDLTGYPIEVRVNPAFVRPNEVYKLTGNPAKLHACVGNLDEYALRDTLAWMLAGTEPVV